MLTRRTLLAVLATTPLATSRATRAATPLITVIAESIGEAAAGWSKT